MHEYSIVQSLLDIIEEHARKYEAKSVRKVVVKVGVLSGVEPHLLQIAFDTFKEGTVCDKAILDMHIQPIIARCRSCGEKNEYAKDQIFFECQQCGNVDLEILDGESMLLMSLDLDLE